MMRYLALGVALAAASGCGGGDESRRLPPQTTIDDKPAAVTNQTRARISFHGSANANHFTCQLDGGTQAACTSPFEADVTDGDHTFFVAAAIDKVVDDSPASAMWTVDTVAPETTLVSGPPALDNSLSPAFMFQGSDNRGVVTFECALDGAAFAGCASPATITVADGSHTHKIRAVDAAGNADPTPVVTTWTVDSTAPDTMITAGPTAGSTTGAGASFSFGSPDSPVTFECSLDGAAFAACTSPRALTPGDGAHTFAVRARDEVGLVDPSPAMRAWTVDATPPSVMITSSPSNPSNLATGTFAFSSPDATATFACQVDAGAFAACTSGFMATSLADGSHTFTVRATDPVGNSGTASVTWTIDTVPPTVTITAGPPAATSSTSASFSFTTAGAPMTVACRLDGGAFAACTSPQALNGLAEGMHSFTVRATDAAGNQGSDSRMWTIDTTPPAVTITMGPANPTNDSTPSFSFTVTGATTIECRTDSGGFAGCTSPFTSAALSDGSHAVTVRGTDAVGNAGTASQTFTVDTVAPVVTVTPVTTPTNDATPSVSFTVTGATAIQCQVDSGAFATCTSPFTPAALADGSHTVTVRGTDAAGNAGTGSTTFTVDTTPPPVAFDDVPPAQWPVNYFDMRFHSTDGSATLTCSLNGAAFAACTSPLAITTVYNATSTFSVRARDAAGNTSTVSTSWMSRDGLVLHYPWEQGQTHNTSLLAQNPAYSPDAPASVTLSVTGGWAGTAIASPIRHTYANTIRALSSSADGGYTASVWVRVSPNATSGTIFSTLATNNGIALTYAGSQVTLQVNDSGTAFTVSTVIPFNQWVQIGLRTTGPGTGLQLLVNGSLATTVTPPVMNGFGPGQAPNMTIGNISGVDLDDLRFYNRALTSSELCTMLVRGQANAAGACVPLIPGFELDFENNQVINTGIWALNLSPPSQASFVPTPLGTGIRLSTTTQSFLLSRGFAGQVSQSPGHSFSFWFVAGSVAETLIDFSRDCGVVAFATCGIAVTYSSGALNVVAGNGGMTPFSRTIPVATGLHSVLVTEKKAADRTTTLSLSIYIDGLAPTVMTIGSGNVYASTSDIVTLPHAQGTTVDEYEFWPRDLSLDPEMLCENGTDGEWDPAANVCLLISN